MKTRSIVAALACCLLPAGAWADTLTLRSGTRYTGTMVSASGNVISFRTDSGARRTFAVRDVARIEFEAPASSSGMLNGAPPASAAGLMVPAGAEISVRTNQAIDSETATTGRTYSAEIEKDVLNDAGAVVIPRGADAELVIREVSEGGAFGGPQLVLDLNTVSIGGRRYLVSASDVERSSDRGIGANRRTATMVGGGAALGTLLGAIAGGGKGAALGALAGAAAGGAVQVLTKGKEVRVPAETVLTFRVEQPLRLERS